MNGVEVRPNSKERNLRNRHRGKCLPVPGGKESAEYSADGSVQGSLPQKFPTHNPTHSNRGLVRLTRSLKTVGANATLVSADLETFARRLKADVGGVIDVVGSQLAASL